MKPYQREREVVISHRRSGITVLDLEGLGGFKYIKDSMPIAGMFMTSPEMCFSQKLVSMSCFSPKTHLELKFLISGFSPKARHSKPRKHSATGVHLTRMPMTESCKVIKPFTRKQRMPVRRLIASFVTQFDFIFISFLLPVFLFNS